MRTSGRSATTPLGKQRLGAYGLMCCVLAATVLAAGCKSNSGDKADKVRITPFTADASGQPPAPGDPILMEHIQGAAGYAAATMEPSDSPSKIILGNLGVRYGISELTPWLDKGARQMRDEAKAWENSPSDVPWSVATQRLADPSFTGSPELLAKIPSDEILSALPWAIITSSYCDTPNMPADWIVSANNFLDTVEAQENTAEGDDYDPLGYITTHIAIAVVIMDERGCAPQGLEELRERTIRMMSDGLQANHTVNDLNIERMAVLYELGRSDLVAPTWITDVLVAQQPNGAWTLRPSDTTSDWHPTLLALWLLCAYNDPSAEGHLFQK